MVMYFSIPQGFSSFSLLQTTFYLTDSVNSQHPGPPPQKAQYRNIPGGYKFVIVALYPLSGNYYITINTIFRNACQKDMIFSYLIFVIFCTPPHFLACKLYARKVRKFATTIASRQNSVNQYLFFWRTLLIKIAHLMFCLA